MVSVLEVLVERRELGHGLVVVVSAGSTGGREERRERRVRELCGGCDVDDGFLVVVMVV